jgi:hypothetical protein
MDDRGSQRLSVGAYESKQTAAAGLFLGTGEEEKQ